MNPRIVAASEADFSVIEQLAKSLDLDWEEVSWDQFVVAKQGSNIIGFGRVRKYADCAEIATVGVAPQQRKKRVGQQLMEKLIQLSPSEVFVTCVIPDFFSRFGFKPVKQYPPVLQKKVDFCKSYHFCDEQIFVMKLEK
jgi:N-acetylglutamate synthase-like GNAT family acetyltransferase